MHLTEARKQYNQTAPVLWVIDAGGLIQFFQTSQIPESIGDFIIVLALKLYVIMFYLPLSASTWNLESRLKLANKRRASETL